MASECGCKLDLVIVHASDGPTTDSIINRSECRIADLERQLAEAQRAIEHDRSIIADAVSGLERILASREWLAEYRGSYEWDDDKWHDEFKAAAAEIRGAIEPFVKIAADLTNSPQKYEDVIDARRNLAQERDDARKELAEAQQKHLEAKDQSAEFMAQLEDSQFLAVQRAKERDAANARAEATERQREVSYQKLSAEIDRLKATVADLQPKAAKELALENQVKLLTKELADLRQERDAAIDRAEAAERERALDICKTPEWQSVNAERLAMGTKLRQAEKLANLSQDNQERWMKIADLRQVQLEAAERERDRLKELLDPGTLEARIDWLAEYTEKEFHHNRFSARGFETTLVKGVADLRVRIAQLEQERDAKEEELDVWRNEATPSQQRAAKRIAQLEAALRELIEAIEKPDRMSGVLLDKCEAALATPGSGEQGFRTNVMTTGEQQKATEVYVPAQPDPLAEVLTLAEGLANRIEAEGGHGYDVHGIARDLSAALKRYK